jgi:hypothetical protein
MGLMISVSLWTVALAAAAICAAVSAVVGRTPATEVMFAVSLAAGTLGIAVDRMRR